MATWLVRVGVGGWVGEGGWQSGCEPMMQPFDACAVGAATITRERNGKEGKKKPSLANVDCWMDASRAVAF